MITAVVSDSVVSPLGIGSALNFQSIQNGLSGIDRIENPAFSDVPFYGSWIKSLSGHAEFTRFEQLSIQSIEDALQKAGEKIDRQKAAFILSTTKGNVEHLADADVTNQDLYLHHTAAKLAAHFGFQKSFVVSNACASGVVAVMLGKHLLEAGAFNQVVVTGTDVLSKFIVSGFRGLHALSDEPCKPFDAHRKGLNLGEASATVILSSTHQEELIVYGAGATNDSNHISGPSRTGEELAAAIAKAVKPVNTIDFISAHGTATLFNDEMESKAFHHAGLAGVPVHSLKGYFGHTLGAAGLVEVVMSMESLRNNQLIATKGFETLGVSKPLNIIQQPEQRSLQAFLKTASGFGGCNAAMVIGKS